MEGECKLGKRVMVNPEVHELPEYLSALFVVDQKGKGLIGRTVTAYGHVSGNMVKIAAAAPDVVKCWQTPTFQC